MSVSTVQSGLCGKYKLKSLASEMAERQSLASNVVICNVEESCNQSDSAQTISYIKSALNISNTITNWNPIP